MATFASFIFLSATVAPAYALENSVLAHIQSFYDVVSVPVVLCGSVILYFIYRVFLYPFYFSPLRHLPEPKGATFPWGHARSMWDELAPTPYRTWPNEVDNNGLLRVRLLFNQEKLIITSPEALKEVTITKSYEFIKPPLIFSLLKKVAGNGLLLAEGNDHKRQRKGLSPSFAFRHIKDLYPVFWAKAKESTDAIAAEVKARPGQALKAYTRASRVTLDIIGVAALGRDFNAIREPSSDVVTTYRNLMENKLPIVKWEACGITVPTGLIFRLPLQKVKETKVNAEKVRGLCYDMVRTKRAAFEKANGNTDVDILSVAIGSGAFPSDDELVDQLMTFLAAGHETTSSALTWAIKLLCKHPDVQSRLRSEIRSNLPSASDPDSTVTALEVDHLTYLNAVCNEVFRFSSPVPSVQRIATYDTTILNQKIPKGTLITIPCWGLNLSPALWGDDAHVFNPERWLAEGQANVGGASSNYAYMTFLHGPRSCIGKDFAKAEFMCLLAAWIGRFEVRLEDGAEEEREEGWITTKPERGLRVIFTEVEGW